MARSKKAADDWTLIRHFIPTEDGPNHAIIASLGMDRNGFVATGEYPDGRSWGVRPLSLGHAQLVVWHRDASIKGTQDGWDYASEVLAVICAHLWDGDGIEPGWWDHHPGSGRRRRYHKDGSYDERVEE